MTPTTGSANSKAWTDRLFGRSWLPTLPSWFTVPATWSPNQPALGGPVYWIRNIAYNLPGGSTPVGWRLLRRGVLQQYDPVGDFRHAAERALAEQSDTGTEREVFWWRYGLFSMSTNTNYSSSDYNGFGPAPDSDTVFRWNSPPSGISADYPAPGHSPALERREFATLEAYSESTSQDRHSVDESSAML